MHLPVKGLRAGLAHVPELASSWRKQTTGAWAFVPSDVGWQAQ